MECRHCRARIADKAIVCYRCGTPTAAPPPVTPAARPTSGGAAWILAVLVALAAGVAWWLVPGPYTDAARLAAAAVTIVSLVLALWLKRRR